ncbi:MAG: putative bifunctional diguanylate cyclase/phosphodiesterase, partial [Solirubrobacteraceae bacterium]
RTVAQRRSAVAGWLVSSFDLPTLITQAIGGNHGLQVELMFTEPDGRATLLATGGDAGARGRLSQTTTVAVDGDWTVVVRGAPVVSGLSAQSGGILVFLSGAAITVLLSLLLLTLSRSRERALAMVAEKTAQLRHQALHDALTGLPNRVLVLDRAEQMLARALRSRTPIALLYIDVDGFKHINDTFGHAIGDRFLQLVAARLLSVVRESDTAARLGGDEFIVLLEGASIETGPEAVAERVLDVLREPYDLTRELGRQLTVSASIGVAFGQPETAEALLADGDVALYAAKEGGKNRFAVFAPGMQTPAHDRIRLELDLAEAIDQDQLFLVYQPTFDLSSGRATAVEALLRWRHPVRGVIAPDVLIPIAEGAGLIVEIGRWVLAQACGQAVAWHAEGHTVSVSVNVSSRQLDRDQLTDDVREALQRTGLEPSWLTLEITEPALLREPDATARRLAALKRLGVRIAIDDFGTGHSSIAYLRQFPVDTLKIDSSFVGMIGSSTEALAIVDTLIDIGRTLALQTVGEGIEDPEQLELLQRAGCDAGQGFLFTRPLDPEDLGRFLDASERAPAATAAGQS